MKHWLEIVVVLAVLLVVPSGVVFAEGAGFIPESIGVELADEWSPGHGSGPPPWAGPPDFVFDLIPGQNQNGRLKLTELFGGPETLAHVVSGETDVDPIMTIVKEITNDSGFTWYGFELTIPDDGDNVFSGTPTCDVFTLISQEDHKVVFGTPDTLDQGETMILDFDILVPSTGPFSFTLTQTPIPVPEPSALILLVVGGFCLAFGVRKR